MRRSAAPRSAWASRSKPRGDGLTLYRLDLRYDGRPFQGWQSQPDGSGVQDHLEKALRTFLRHDLRVTGASRTDSGVHAEHQVATFSTDVAFDARRWLRSLHGLLPEAVGVMGIQPVEAAFHPILSAKGKAYRYRLWLSESRHPFGAPYAWTVPATLDLALMGREAASFVGTHDYTSFCAVDSSAKTKVRTVTEVAVLGAGPLVEVWVLGEGFLKQMVRSMVGTLVAVGAGRYPPGSVAPMLAALDRKAAGQTAPAAGLCLVEIFYDELRSARDLRAASRDGFTFACR